MRTFQEPSQALLHLEAPFLLTLLRCPGRGERARLRGQEQRQAACGEPSMQAQTRERGCWIRAQASTVYFALCTNLNSPPERVRV